MSTPLRREYLAALGLQAWVMRTPATAAATESAALGELAAIPAPTATVAARPAPPAPTAPQAPQAPPAPTAPQAARASAEVLSADRESGFDWAQLRARVASCTRCGLAATRTQTVFGVGDPAAGWLVVGEAPGAEEDLRGEPFVGRAGQLLNAMLRAIGLAREQVYIANMLKCRPPQNRDPLAGEVAECAPYLERQVALIKPKIMLVVGRIAAQNLLQTTVPLGRLRQQVHAYGTARVPMVVTYHPAYLLRTPGDKRKAWDDLKFAREVSTRG